MAPVARSGKFRDDRAEHQGNPPASSITIRRRAESHFLQRSRSDLYWAIAIAV